MRRRGGVHDGISQAPDGGIWFVLAVGSYLGHVDSESGAAEAHLTSEQGPGRAPCSRLIASVLWISERNAVNVSVYDPGAKTWKTCKLPGQNHVLPVDVDAGDKVWLTDFTANAILQFDP